MKEKVCPGVRIRRSPPGLTILDPALLVSQATKSLFSEKKIVTSATDIHRQPYFAPPQLELFQTAETMV
ncbi:MAG: hypothetical protein U9Q37_11100 [Euryarchaeota archaeon]|nr:hypothetical protein [Euryarchaeota archaeon]